MRDGFHVALVLSLIVALTAGCGAEQPSLTTSGDAQPSREIRAVMERQAAAWNEGDIPGYMEGYARTDSLRFASGGSVVVGWEQTLERYEAAYPDTAAMGHLTFHDLDIWLLSDDAAVVFGRWELARSEPLGAVGGLFTLVFQRGAEGWRIVHDHTSARTTGS